MAHTIKPDIIITAVMLPGMNGIELCRSIKSDPVTAGIPVIILTAKMSSDSRIEAYEAGADSYIQKPIDSNILISRIENILSNKEKLVRKISSGGGREHKQYSREPEGHSDEEIHEYCAE